MNTVTATQTDSKSLPHRKRLEGVGMTDELRQLIRDVRSIGSTGQASSTKKKGAVECIYNATYSFTGETAVETLRSFDTTSPFIPISVLRAVENLCDGKTEYLERLDKCLRATKLAFTPPPPESPESEGRKKFRRRIERLKLKDEERNYGGLVKNVGLQGPADDVTTRSMTYAASIGLNMIIAPLSFGCFMYFFAGGIFSYMGWGDDRPARLGPDIRKVIAGVVSGVFMLIVEMILFVIRSHEMDKAMRKKAKKSKRGAFGHYTADTARHFKGD